MSQKITEHKTVVFAPLNWGLGHASRLVPLIRKYKKNNWKIILASDGVALRLLKSEFPDMEALDIKSKTLKYSKQNNLGAHLFNLIQPFLKNIKEDQVFVENLVKKEQIDLIISDNRYGFRHPSVKSVVITHQLQLATPRWLSWGRFVIQNKINKWLNTFDECWIVDDDKHSFAGGLSQEEYLKIPFQFMGLQSRFVKDEQEQDIDFLIVLSGLEPQRTILEEMLIKVFENTKNKVVLVGGKFDEVKDYSGLKYISFADTQELNNLLNRTKCVIARSGYSTIMDIIKLNKKAILIPTPGQTEQEYLAKFHTNKLNFFISNNEIDSIKLAIKVCEN